MNFATQVLWVYITLLLIGGMIGYLKAKSRVSLITSTVSAVILILCALQLIFQPYVADIVISLLLLVFMVRLVKTKKFMPAGMMMILSVVALALRHLRF